MPRGKGPDSRAAFRHRKEFGQIKDSGKKQEYASGMRRDVTDGKTKYHLCLDGPMFQRWAKHLTTGAELYGDRNWMNASTQEDLERFRESALRHMIQAFEGDESEDHKAAVVFNLNGWAYVEDKLRGT